jgi:cell division protein FtsQ
VSVSRKPKTRTSAAATGSLFARYRSWFTRGNLIRLLLGAAGVLLVAAIPRALSRSSFFRVSRVEVVGIHYLSGPEVVAALGLRRNASLFDATEPVKRSAIAIRGVRRAWVTRRWPGTLVVRVEEFEPVALSPGRDRLVLIDGRGRVLPFDPTRAPSDLPVAPADPALARLIARIKETEPALFRQIVSASRERQVVTLELGERRFLLRPDANAAQLRALVAVMDDLARKGRRYRELDARFTDRVFVRGKPS